MQKFAHFSLIVGITIILSGCSGSGQGEASSQPISSQSELLAASSSITQTSNTPSPASIASSSLGLSSEFPFSNVSSSSTPPLNRAPSISGDPVAGMEGVMYIFTPVITDPDGDALTLSIENAPAWLSFDNATGTLSGIPDAASIGTYRNIKITADDGVLQKSRLFEIEIAYDPLEEAIRTGDARLVKTAQTYYDALIETTIEQQENDRKNLHTLFNLNSDGSEKIDGTSLTRVTWDPTHDAALLETTFGNNQSIFISNALGSNASGHAIQKNTLAIAGETSTTRYAVFGGNPIRRASHINEQGNKLIDNVVSWLTKRSNLKTAPFNIVMAHLDQSFYFPDEAQLEAWFDGTYNQQVTYNARNACDGAALTNCLTNNTDLLVISQVLGEHEASTVLTAVDNAMQAGIPVLYVHHDGNLTTLGSALFSLFNVTYVGDNYWRRLAVENFSPTDDIPETNEYIKQANALTERLNQDGFSFDIAQCGESYFTSTPCSEDIDGSDTHASRFNQEFNIAAKALRKRYTELDKNKNRIFEKEGYRYDKIMLLLADALRQTVTFPMGKKTTSRKDFMASFFADHVVFNSRSVNAAQPDMGNFSRSDFSHVTPTSKVIDMESKRHFRAAGVYALPGKTFNVTRLDNSSVNTSIVINTLRHQATHTFQNDESYVRPKYLTSVKYSIKSGETISMTPTYGGTIQVHFDTNDLPVQFRFDNIGEHPFWQSAADNTTFTQQMLTGHYDWAEMVTPGFEIHSKLERMRTSFSNPNWNTPALMSAAVERYVHNFPHVLAGFKGPGIEVVAEIHDFANNNNLTIQNLDLVKHMNADQASCGSGCSGNPYDAYWSFNPIGHGDIHELGHGLEKKRMRFDNWVTHASTNPYSYFTKSQYFKNTGNTDYDCQALPFQSMFELAQNAKKAETEAERHAIIEAGNISGTWNKGFMVTLQILMAAQDHGVVTDGWLILPRVHIIEREFNLAIKNESDWLAKRNNLGFSTYSHEEIKTISQTDFLIIAYAKATGLDYRHYLAMWNLETTDKASLQIETLNFPTVERYFYVSEPRTYCEGLNKPKISIDGSTPWPLSN